MRVLFDHGTPTALARSLTGHEVTEAIDRGWDRISNGELLKVAEEAGFAVNAAVPGSFAEVEIPLPPKPPFVRS